MKADSQETGCLPLPCLFALPCENSDSIETEPRNAMQEVGQGLNQRWMKIVHLLMVVLLIYSLDYPASPQKIRPTSL